MSGIAVITTFPNNMWQVCAKAMLESYVKFWPADIPLLVQLDDDLLLEDVKRVLRPNDGVTSGWDKEHADFVSRNKGKDHKTDYRKQAVRFCHKVFAIKHTLDAVEEARKDGIQDVPRYLIWMDSDVITTSNVSREMLTPCLPKEGDAVAYLGRKNWDHSECGWLAFDLENGGKDLIEAVFTMYVNDDVFDYPQWHDSWIWDDFIAAKRATNLTKDKPGMDIWQHSPMAAFSTHHKGPVAKNKMKPNQGVPLTIMTKNSIPDESIKKNILENQAQIKNWIRTCLPNDEEIVVVSAGPMMIPEDLVGENGKKIVAVKHALKPLKEVGIKPWACILLDPRPHVNEFVENPDTDILWFVASQVEAKVVKTLLDAGCTVWGYHAAVGAHEEELTSKQPDSIVSGGSATATRGLFLLDKLGFRNFRLYGYDLCYFDKPDLDLKDEVGQPKYFEVSIAANHVGYKAKKAFWSSGELLAQYQEFVDIMQKTKWNLRAFGCGMIPFITESKRIGDLREKAKKDKIGVSLPVSYEELLCNKKNNFWMNLLKVLRKTLLKQMKASSF